MRPEVREQLRQMLMQDEGWRAFAYTDTVGKLTIGYGRNLADVGISLAEGRVLLDNDINAALSALAQKLPWFETLDATRQLVLVNLCFNMGIDGLLKFQHMLTALKIGDYETAAHELESSRWYSQVGHRGPRLVAMLKTGRTA